MQVGFSVFNGTDLEGVRITGPAGTTAAQDLEPEYIAIAPNNQTAYVACEENNALVIVDTKRRRVDGIVSLGDKDHSLPGNELDASNRDGAVNITNWPAKGLYMPDAIAAYEADGGFFLVTANEGDSREHDDYVDEARVKDAGDPEEGVAPLDESLLAAYPDLQDNANLGRIKFIATNGELVFDSGAQFEQLTASAYPV